MMVDFNEHIEAHKALAREEWICVEEALPAFGELVLVWSGTSRRPYVACRAHYKCDEHNWWCIPDGGVLIHVDHWMPLPDEPEEPA
jgi:hypothetical protein